MTTREHWIDLGPGRRIHCEEEGEGPAVVFLPGNGCSIGDAGPLRDAIVRRYRFIGIDTPGRPPSAWPDEAFHFVNDLGPLVGVVLERLGVGEHAVIGHSMGGMLALQHAHRFRGKIRGQVRGLVLMEGFVSLKVHANVVSPEGFRAVRMPEAIHRDWESRIKANRAWLDAHPTFKRTFWESQHEHDARPWVGELGLPIQVFVGGLGQPMAPLDDMGAWRRHLGMEGVKDLEVHVVPNAGHWMLLDDPPAVETPVMAFLARVLGTG